MCQARPTGLYTRSELLSEFGKVRQRHSKMKVFENMVMSYFQRVKPQCKVQSFYSTGTQKKIDACSFDGFFGHCNTVFGVMGCYYQYCPCREARDSLTEEEVRRGIRKTELDKLRKQYIQEKGFSVF